MRLSSLGFVSGLVLGLGPARAAPSVVDVELTPKAQLGQGQPRLTVHANVAVRQLRIDVRRSVDGVRVRRRAGPLRAGEQHDFELPLTKPGQARFEGTLQVRTEDGAGTMPLAVEVSLLAPLELSVEPADVDLEARTLKLRASRPLQQVVVSVTSDTGALLGTTETTLDPSAAAPIEIRWAQEPGRVLRVSIEGTDVDGFFGGIELHPWHVDIPHEDVEFATGEAIITELEAPKLEASHGLLVAALSRYGRLAQGLTVFVAGHTDTVGSAADNRTLSERRARAIGVWFRKAGLQVPIRYAGFGETRLLVQTPDETDEPRNRRAEYIVAIDPPALSGPAVRWRPL